MTCDQINTILLDYWGNSNDGELSASTGQFCEREFDGKQAEDYCVADYISGCDIEEAREHIEIPELDISYLWDGMGAQQSPAPSVGTVSGMSEMPELTDSESSDIFDEGDECVHLNVTLGHRIRPEWQYTDDVQGLDLVKDEFLRNLDLVEI